MFGRGGGRRGRCLGGEGVGEGGVWEGRGEEREVFGRGGGRRGRCLGGEGGGEGVVGSGGRSGWEWRA